MQRPKNAAFDQANKGQCLLPLILCFVYTNTQISRIPYVGESKTTLPNLAKLNDLMKTYDIKYKFFYITTDELDSSNINQLITQRQHTFVKSLNPINMYLDCHLHDVTILKTSHQRNHPCTNYIVEHRLDATNSLVGLASLLAKLEKNRMYSEFEKTNKVRLGSGNLGDSITLRYIRDNWPDVPGLRKKWNLSKVLKI